MRSHGVMVGSPPGFLVGAMREREVPLGALLARFTVETSGPVGEPAFGVGLRPAGPPHAHVRARP
ncbi:hypothetical protein ACIQ62_01685 [Streptomyces sp. NPDC096319]|uniref:hypothetical protein n=1 Tax=Streptomyces sp. NPDC096319 TaxID=3366084 RepID=UPI00382E979A